MCFWGERNRREWVVRKETRTGQNSQPCFWHCQIIGDGDGEHAVKGCEQLLDGTRTPELEVYPSHSSFMRMASTCWHPWGIQFCHQSISTPVQSLQRGLTCFPWYAAAQGSLVCLCCDRHHHVITAVWTSWEQQPHTIGKLKTDEDGKVLCWSLCCVGAELEVEAETILGSHCSLGRLVEVAVLEPLPRGCS